MFERKTHKKLFCLLSLIAATIDELGCSSQDGATSKTTEKTENKPIEEQLECNKKFEEEGLPIARVTSYVNIFKKIPKGGCYPIRKRSKLVGGIFDDD
jgi:hypothetical protein